MPGWCFTTRLRRPGNCSYVEGSRMTALVDMAQSELQEFLNEQKLAYQKLCDAKLSLDLTRGKPSAEQLDFSLPLMALPTGYRSVDGTDCRNYGGLKGIQEIREIYAELLGVPVENLWAADASSLNIEHDLINLAYVFGTQDSPRPWSQEETVKWLCPVPGYDRHFTITETFGFEMIPVPMTDEGPDMDVVRELVKDPAVKGMWTVPVYSNPTGITISPRVCQELASMETAAPDFRIMWDNAYAVHILGEEFPTMVDVLGLSAAAGNPNRFWIFASTSKVTFAGSGVSFLAASTSDLEWYARFANVRGIGPNKMNQLAHAEFFGDATGVRALMLKHRDSLAPKFDAVLAILDERLGGTGVATWTRPEGGYFISVDVLPGTAKRVVELAGQAGIALTAAGSTYPLKADPEDKNLRLAPSMPPVDELKVAMDGVATCMLLAAAEQLAG